MQLYSWTSEGEARIVGKNHDEHLNLVLSKISDNVPNVSSRVLLSIILYHTIYMKLVIYLANLLNQLYISVQSSHHSEGTNHEKLIDLRTLGFEKCWEICTQAMVDRAANSQVANLVRNSSHGDILFSVQGKKFINYSSFRFLVKI